jgi:lipopolysaccharide heptosyltransferase II
MNILQIVPHLNVGGVETGTVDLARSLKERNHKPIVISAGGRLVQELEAANIKHYCLSVDKKSIFNILKMIPQVVEIIKKEEIDIVHARSRVPAWIGYFACRRTRKVFITTSHGYYSHHFFSRIMARGKFVIVPSQIIGKHMLNDFNVASERLQFIERSVNLDRFKFKPVNERSKTEFIIANVARLTPIKGHVYFLRAISKIIRSIPHIQVWIVGSARQSDTGYLEELKVLTRRLGISHCVKFMGLRDDIPKILMNVHALVLSSIVPEAFGRVIIEAQASGVPVVATKVGGVVEIIEDGLTGILVPPKDPDTMAEAIIKVLKNPNLSQMLADNAYKKVKQAYTLTKMVDKTLEVYNRALILERILIIKYSALGDILLITPSLKAIREKFKSSKIYCLTSVAGSQILKTCPYIDELVIYDHKHQDKGLKALLNIGAKLRSIGFDKVIDFQNSNRSHVLAFLSLAPDRYGYDNRKLSFFLNKKVKEKKQALDPVEHQSKTLKLLDIEVESKELEVWPTLADKEYVDEMLKSYWLKGSAPLVGIHIGASKKWLTKLWPTYAVASLIELLSKENIRVILMGLSSDFERGQEILRKSKIEAINACGKTSILQLAELMKRCNCILTNDSLAMHMAAAVKVPFVALFGPTDPTRHMPPAKLFMRIRKELKCSPCYKKKCKDMRCMLDINPREVLAAIKNFL